MGSLLVMGAGGYTLGPESEFLDRYFLRRIGKKNPRICLLPTACGDRQETVERFHAYFHSLGATTGQVSLFAVDIENIESHLLRQDGIYITGGNTRSMLALWREWGVDRALRKAYESEIVMCGVSAGAMSFFEEGFSDSQANRYSPLKCLGFLQGSFCPHYVPGRERALAFHEHIQTRKMKPGIGLEDGISLYYENGKLSEMIRSRNGVQAYRVDPSREPEPIEI